MAGCPLHLHPLCDLRGVASPGEAPATERVTFTSSSFWGQEEILLPGHSQAVEGVDLSPEKWVGSSSGVCRAVTDPLVTSLLSWRGHCDPHPAPPPG